MRQDRYSLFRRGTNWYVQFYNPHTRKYLSARSTGESNRNAALLVVSQWMREGVPDPARGARRARALCRSPPSPFLSAFGTMNNRRMCTKELRMASELAAAAYELPCERIIASLLRSGVFRFDSSKCSGSFSCSPRLVDSNAETTNTIGFPDSPQPSGS